MTKFLATISLVLLAGCASGAHGGSGDGIGGARAPAPSLEVTVVILDDSARTAVHPADVAVMLYLDEKLPPQGCATVAQMLTEANIASDVRRAVTERAAQLGATLVVIADRQQVTVETVASRSGIGFPRTSTRYAIEAFDCR